MQYVVFLSDQQISGAKVIHLLIAKSYWYIILTIIVSFADCSNSSDYIGSLPKQDCSTGHLDKCTPWLAYLHVLLKTHILSWVLLIS